MLAENNRHSVLQISGDHDDSGKVRNLLHCFHYEVVPVKDVDQALAQIGQRPFDAMVIDCDAIKSPQNAHLLRLREAIPLIPILCVANQNHPLLRLQLIQSGFDQVYNKPVDPLELVSALTALTRHRSILQEYCEKKMHLLSVPPDLGKAEACWSIDRKNLNLCKGSDCQIWLNETERVFLISLYEVYPAIVGHTTLLKSLAWRNAIESQHRLSTAVSRLRSKIIRIAGCAPPFDSVYARGYVWCERPGDLKSLRQRRSRGMG